MEVDELYSKKFLHLKYNDFLEIIVKLSIIISFPKIGYEDLDLSYNERNNFEYYYKFESFCIKLV